MLRRNAGYSLYELLMTLLLASVVLTVGLPSFSGTIARHKQRIEINALFHAIHVARKESIMRRKVVSLCPSADGKRCQPGRNWSSGWIMFENVDADHPPQVDAGEPLLHRHIVEPTVRVTANRRGFTLRSTEKRATNGTFVVCDQRDRITPKALVISYTGRPRVATSKRSGAAYNCAP